MWLLCRHNSVVSIHHVPFHVPLSCAIVQNELLMHQLQLSVQRGMHGIPSGVPRTQLRV